MVKSVDYFKSIATAPETKISLAKAALQIALDEYPDLNVAHYTNLLKNWSDVLRAKCSRLGVHLRLDRMNDWLFSEMSFSGNIDDYYDPRNSFLNDVMDRRTGIPISLSVIYLELAWSLGLKASGIAFPGHFLVKVIAEEEPLYIDAFHKGSIMSAEGCVHFLKELTEGELEFDHKFLNAVNKKEILSRMLRNLKRIYLEMNNYSKLIRISDRLVDLNPDSSEEIRDRGIIYYQMKAFKNASKDFETFLSMAPDSEDAELIHQYLQILREYNSRLN